LTLEPQLPPPLDPKTQFLNRKIHPSDLSGRYQFSRIKSCQQTKNGNNLQSTARNQKEIESTADLCLELTAGAKIFKSGTSY